VVKSEWLKLAAQVRAGELSASAAAIKAGFKKDTFSRGSTHAYPKLNFAISPLQVLSK
jgi:hypothetical protein